MILPVAIPQPAFKKFAIGMPWQFSLIQDVPGQPIDITVTVFYPLKLPLPYR